jgi:hypothetical protein
MAVDNNLILAALAIGAIYLVVQSGEKNEDEVLQMQEDEQGAGMSRAEAIDRNPTAQMDSSRGVCVEDLKKAIKEFQFLKNFERENEMTLQELHQFPAEIWARIEGLQRFLRELGARAEPLFMRHGSELSDAFWGDYDKLWQGHLTLGDKELTLRQTTPGGEPSDVPEGGTVDDPSKTNTVAVAGFMQAQAPVKVEIFNQEMFRQMLRFAFDNLGLYTANILRTAEQRARYQMRQDGITWFPKEHLPLALTNNSNSAFNTLPEHGPTNEEKEAEQMNEDGFNGIAEADGQAPAAVASAPEEIELDLGPGIEDAARGEDEEKKYGGGYPRKTWLAGRGV